MYNGPTMSPGMRLPRGSRLALGLRVIAAFYLLAVALLPLAHHDVVCHTKSATHCTTCVVGSSVEPSSDRAGLAQAPLADLGAAAVVQRSGLTAASLGVAAGRAPPAVL